MTAPTKPADCSSMVVPSLTWPGAPSNSDVCTTAYGDRSPPSPHPAPKWGPQGSPPGQILRDPPSQQPNGGLRRSPPARYCEIPPASNPSGGLRRIFTPGRYCEISPASNPMGAPEDLHPGQILRDLPSQRPKWGAPEDLHPGQILRDLPSQQPKWGAPGGLPPGRYCEPPAKAQRPEHRATPGGYGGKTPGVAIIGVPTGARNAGKWCSDGGPEHRRLCYTKAPPCVSTPYLKPISARTAADLRSSAVT